MAKKKSGGGGEAGGKPKPAEEKKTVDPDDHNTAVGCDNKDKEKAKDNKGKKAPPPLPVVTAVLKVDMHCDGCAKRIRASVRHYPGVEGVAMDVDKATMTVVGRFDAKKLRDRVARKTKKKVDLVVQNKGNDGEGAACKKKQQQQDAKVVHEYGGVTTDCYAYDLFWLNKVMYGGCKTADVKGAAAVVLDQQHGKKQQDNKDDRAAACGAGGGKDKQDVDGSKKAASGDKAKGGGKDAKKPAVPVVGTVVLKIGAMGLHCDGCMKRVRTKLFKIKGVEQVRMELGKNQVTVTGTMDVKALPGKLQKKLRRPVDVVPSSSANNKEKDGCSKQQQDANKQKQQQEGCSKDKDAATTKALTAEVEMWKTAFYYQQSLINTEFLLSDENPNAACIVM